jgi:hypothetical protein
MPFQFPDPEIDNTYTYNRVDYIYDGLSWKPDKLEYFNTGKRVQSVGGILTLEVMTADYFDFELTEDTTLVLTDHPEFLEAKTIGIRITSNSEYTSSNSSITWPSNIVWQSGSPPLIPDSDEYILLEFSTSDAGENYFATIVTGRYTDQYYWASETNKFNLVGNPIDIYGWVGRDGAITTGLRCNISRDASVTDSPFGGIPMSMTITGDGNDPQIGTYNNVNGYTWNIAPAESGQIWEMRVLAKASQSGLQNGQIFMFGVGSDGLWANTGGDIIGGIIQFDTIWKEFKTTFTINNLDVRYIQVRLDGPQADAVGETVWWDGLQVYRIG